jgi:MoxR-like ATPase
MSTSSESTAVAELYGALADELGTVLIGNRAVVEGLTVALLTRGHVLLEGVPGVAKTTIANAFARATGLEYHRIQMTPDVLPADITGTNIFRQQTGTFEVHRGPVFANVVVADEVNRATPKTQSALLEAMEERTVTIEGETLQLPRPFLLVATQNPVEMEGTFELPLAQRDRFQLRYDVGLPTHDEEFELLDRFDSDPELGPETVRQVVTEREIEAARDAATRIHVSDDLKEYVLALVAATRTHPAVEHGASPRASIAFLNAGKARAAIHGRDYVLPDDVRALAVPILAHRLVLDADAVLGDVRHRDVVVDVLEAVTVPGETDETEPLASRSGRAD